MSITIQIVLFLSASILSLFLLRKRFSKGIFKENKNSPETLSDEFIGKTAIALENIEKHQTGKIEFKGAQWNAVAQEAIKKGQAVEIVGKDSITLLVR